MGAGGTAGQGLQGVGLWAEAWSCPSQGTQYVWNRTALIQASKDPSVTHLMGNDPTHPTVLPWDGCLWSSLHPNLPVTTGPLSHRPL